MEELFQDHGVDVAVWAHEHSYERLLPVYNRTVMSGPKYLRTTAKVNLVKKEKRDLQMLCTRLDICAYRGA